MRTHLNVHDKRMNLVYTAYDKTGKAVKGTIDSSDVATAGQMLRQKGLFVAQISDGSAPTTGAKSSRRTPLRFGGNEAAKNIPMFTRQLCVFISCGTQMLEALRSLERQAKPGPWQDTIAGICVRVEEGASLSEALGAYPQHFDSVYRSLVSAGESSGCLAEMLDRVATLKQKQKKVRRSISGALIYPSLLITLTLAMLGLLLTFVVPKFTLLFESMDVPLPASTKALVGVSNVFRQYWWGGFLLIGGGVVGALRFVATEKGRLMRDALLLKLPIIGNIIKSFATARIVRLLGVLMAAHVPILEALSLVKEGAGNSKYSDLIAAAEKNVSQGESISLAFSDESLIDPAVYEVIHSGEASGQVDQLLLNVAGFLEEDNDIIVSSLTTIIEPIIMGILVGSVAVSMFMPLFDLTAMTQASY